MTLNKKEEFAQKLLRAAAAKATECGEVLEISYSGGKDSDVLLHLAKSAGVPYRAIYKVTTIDPPFTEKHARDNGAEIIMPKQNFRQIVAKHGLPSRWRRLCCDILKEYKVMSYAAIGVRRDESKARADRYKEPEQCRVFSKTEKVRQYMPLLDFTKKDIQEYIEQNNIRCHPVYYDEYGQFHVERRLGCVGCPIAYWRRREEQFFKWPGFIKVYTSAMRDYLRTHPNSRLHSYFKDEYEWFVMQLYFDRLADWQSKFNGIDNKNFLSQKFSIKL